MGASYTQLLLELQDLQKNGASPSLEQLVDLVRQGSVEAPGRAAGAIKIFYSGTSLGGIESVNFAGALADTNYKNMILLGDTHVAAFLSSEVFGTALGKAIGTTNKTVIKSCIF